MAELETKTIHSVAKAIRLLDLLAERTKPATLTELYQATGWPKSTIHGLLSTMREAGLIEQTPNGRYWLGIRLFEYGCAVSNAWDIGSIARPHMQKICAELGESVFLSVFDRAAVVTLAEEESRASLRVVSEVGARRRFTARRRESCFWANRRRQECRRLLSISRVQILHAAYADVFRAAAAGASENPRTGLCCGKRGIQGRAALGFRAGARRLGRGALCHRCRRHVPAGVFRGFPACHAPGLRGGKRHFARHWLPPVSVGYSRVYPKKICRSRKKCLTFCKLSIIISLAV